MNLLIAFLVLTTMAHFLLCLALPCWIALDALALEPLIEWYRYQIESGLREEQAEQTLLLPYPSWSDVVAHVSECNSKV